MLFQSVWNYPSSVFRISVLKVTNCIIKEALKCIIFCLGFDFTESLHRRNKCTYDGCRLKCGRIVLHVFNGWTQFFCLTVNSVSEQTNNNMCCSFVQL